MKRILINATHNEEIRVALCKDNHLYDFDLENRTREQKKSNIYKGHVTRVEPSLEAVFVEYGSQRQGFLPIREIASEYLKGNPREDNIRKLIKEGDELIVQIEKEERGNKGAALSTYVSLAGRYLVLMPNNPRGGGISRQITGKLREEMKRMLANMNLPKGMSVIVRTAGIGKTQEDLQHDLNHLLNIWGSIQEQNKKYPSPRLVHQEAGVVTRAVRDYLRDDISEIWIDNENAYNEAESFVKAVMPKQIEKLRKYTDYEPMFASFNIEKQIETAYQREVRLPSGGSIVIDQTEALVSIDINSAKSTKGSDVSETAYHTNLEAAEEIARQLRLRDMGGLIVIDFIDMNDSKHQKDVEKRLVESTKYDRARVQFGDISKFGLMEMSRQRLRPSLEESTGYICPRCHGNGMIRDLRSLSLSIMRQIEEIALKQRHGEVQAEVPTDIAAFLLNEKRESLVYLEQDSGTRITILPHSHLESPNFNLNFNHDGFVPASYDRISDALQQETSERGYEVDWQTNEAERPEQQPIRQPLKNQPSSSSHASSNNAFSSHASSNNTSNDNASKNRAGAVSTAKSVQSKDNLASNETQAKPAAVAWLSNLFAPTPQAHTADSISSQEAATAIEAIVNSGAQSRGIYGGLAEQTAAPSPEDTSKDTTTKQDESSNQNSKSSAKGSDARDSDDSDKRSGDDRRKRKGRSQRSNRGRSQDKSTSDKGSSDKNSNDKNKSRNHSKDNRKSDGRDQDDAKPNKNKSTDDEVNKSSNRDLPKRRQHSRRDSRGSVDRGEALTAAGSTATTKHDKADSDPNEVTLHINEAPIAAKEREVVHISLNDETTTEVSPKSTQVDAKADANTSSTEQAAAQTDKQELETNTSQSQNKGEPSSDDTTLSATTSADTSDSTSKNANETLDKDSSADEPKVKPMRFDSDDLFAERYVTANKYGLAPNDPRVVIAEQRATPSEPTTVAVAQDKAENTPSDSTVPSQRRMTLIGTVGEFIHSNLDDAQTQMAQNGVISSFLAALQRFTGSNSAVDNSLDNKSSQTEMADDATTDTKATETKTETIDFNNLSFSNFSFSNYGYDPLDASYLDEFHTQTSSVAKTNVSQGKTQAQPLTTGKRASNDPRGQHPDYKDSLDNASSTGSQDSAQSSTVSDFDSKVDGSKDLDSIGGAEADTKSSSQTDNKEAQQTSSSLEDSVNNLEAFTQLMSGSVGGFIEKILGDHGTELINQGKTESAFLQALKQPMTDILERLQHAADSLVPELQSTTSLEDSEEETAHALASLDDVNKVEALAEALHEVAVESLSNQEDESHKTQSDSTKTSVASYKSMIENISEQLSPQQGLFNNLTTPKAPSKRGRKAKTDKSNNEDDSN